MHHAATALLQGPWFDLKPPFNHPWFNTTFGGGVKPPMAGLTPLLGEVLNHPVVERFNTGLSFNTGLTLVEHLCLSEVFNHPKRRFFAAAGATRMEGASRGSLPEEEAQQP